MLTLGYPQAPLEQEAIAIANKSPDRTMVIIDFSHANFYPIECPIDFECDYQFTALSTLLMAGESLPAVLYPDETTHPLSFQFPDSF